MAKTYKYKAKNRKGQLIVGTIVAEHQGAVATFIREKGYYVTTISEQKTITSLSDIINNFKQVNLKDLAIFCRLFSTMVGAGISFINCLKILIEQTENHRLKDALSEVYKKVREGESLANSMRNQPKVFPTIMIGMIEAGEAGGVLDQVLSRLTILFEKEYKTTEKLKSTMTYPLVVLSMAIIAVCFILIYILPSFLKIFDKSKIQLPISTRIVIGLSSFLQHYWLVLVGITILFGFAMSVLYKRSDVRIVVDRMLLQMPVFGMLMRKVAIARFAQTLGTLLRSGMSILVALEMTEKASTNFNMIKVISEVQVHVRSGTSLATPLSASGIFTPMVVNMVTIGEETGELDKMLDKVADFYESEVDDMVSRLSSLIEPILIGILGVVIGGIVLAVMLPMIESVTNVGNL